jgi:hypothetical protein
VHFAVGMNSRYVTVMALRLDRHWTSFPSSTAALNSLAAQLLQLLTSYINVGCTWEAMLRINNAMSVCY